MAKIYKAGPDLKSKPRSDLQVSYSALDEPLSIQINSSVKTFYEEAILKLVQSICTHLNVERGVVKVDDFGAVPFVIAARVEAVLKKAFPELTKEYLLPSKKHALYPPKRDRFRRSRLYIPGNQPKLMLNAGIHNPDGIILDFEDAVAPPFKDETRFVVRNALRELDFFGAERMVRINQKEMGLRDLEFVIPHNVHLLLLPKIESAEEVQLVDKRIQEISKRCGRKEPVYLMPIIESGRGVLKALEIAESSKNIVAIAIGLEDYTADLGVQRTAEGRESQFARNMLVNAARAAGIQAIDTVFSDVDNEQALRDSVREAKALGFDGKGCIHPRQIKPVHEEFAPTEQELEKAKKIVLAFDVAQKQGLGVVSLGSKMIDPPVVKRAQKIIDLALMNDLLPKNWKSLK
jgi:citrate lyase subunit beta/citryl-CoA lyase